jgi:hypothetical protein
MLRLGPSSAYTAEEAQRADLLDNLTALDEQEAVYEGPASNTEVIATFLKWADPLRPPSMTRSDDSSPYVHWLRVQYARARARLAGLAEDLAKACRERDRAYERVAELTLSADHRLHKCSDLDCTICAGGLSLCEVCGGGESELPTHCPGEQLTEGQRRGISTGEMDFLRERWWQPIPIARARSRNQKKTENGGEKTNKPSTE